MKLLFILALLTQSLTYGQGLTTGLDKTNPITLAYEGYLNFDYAQTLHNIKSVLEKYDQDPIIKNNILSLYSQLLHTGKFANLDVIPRLPASISRLRITVDRESMNDNSTFSLTVSGDIEELGIIESINVYRFPQINILSKTDGLGKYKEFVDYNPSRKKFYIRTSKTSSQIKSGLYTYEIILKNGTNYKSWFIIDDTMNASESPKLIGLKQNQILYTTTPTFKWKDFFSPEYIKNEKREIYFEVSKSKTEVDDWSTVWSNWQNNPRLTKVKIGETPDESNVIAPLVSGKYMTYLQYTESSLLGHIRMNRKMSSIVDFEVK